MTDTGRKHSLGYTLVLPPGWVMLPTAEDGSAALDSLIETLMAETPVDSRGARGEALKRTLVQMLDDARAANARDVIFPVSQPWMLPASASITIASIPVSPEVTSVRDMQVREANRGLVSVVEMPGGEALRELVIQGSDPDDKEPTARRTVTWTWLPREGTVVLATLVVASSEFDGAGQLLDALQKLGEAVISTIEWTDNSHEGEKQHVEA